jgi:hypothetical protein
VKLPSSSVVLTVMWRCPGRRRRWWVKLPAAVHSAAVKLSVLPSPQAMV